MWGQQGCNPTGSVAHVVWCAVEGLANRQQPWAHRQGQRERERQQEQAKVSKKRCIWNQGNAYTKKIKQKAPISVFWCPACPLKNDQHLLDQQAGTKREKEQAKVSKKMCIWNQDSLNEMYLSGPPIFPAFWVACLACSLMMILWHIHIEHVERERERERERESRQQ